MSSRQLIPGDVIVVLPGKATWNMVLLQGNCLVEESNLSGEVIVAHQAAIKLLPACSELQLEEAVQIMYAS